jgi:hypothetical protein
MAAMSEPVHRPKLVAETHSDVELLQQDVARLTAERDAARNALEQLAHGTNQLAAERDDLRRQLATAWQPVAADAPPIVCQHGVLVDQHGASIAIESPGDRENPPAILCAELPEDVRLYRRAQPAQEDAPHA